MADFIKIVNKKSGKQLLDEIMHTFLRDLSHDFFGRASFIYDCYEVFSESKRNVVDWVLEDVIHYMRKSIYQIIAANNKGFLLVYKLCT